jgi:hypothetical protein
VLLLNGKKSPEEFISLKLAFNWFGLFIRKTVSQTAEMPACFDKLALKIYE